jgi:hypothetical protein
VMESKVTIVGIVVCAVLVIALIVFVIIQRLYWKRLEPACLTGFVIGVVSVSAVLAINWNLQFHQIHEIKVARYSCFCVLIL